MKTTSILKMETRSLKRLQEEQQLMKRRNQPSLWMATTKASLSLTTSLVKRPSAQRMQRDQGLTATKRVREIEKPSATHVAHRAQQEAAAEKEVRKVGKAIKQSKVIVSQSRLVGMCFGSNFIVAAIEYSRFQRPVPYLLIAQVYTQSSFLNGIFTWVNSLVG